MKEKHGEKLKCNICNEELKTEKTLENHYAKKHIVNTIAFLECSSCEYKTMNKYYGPREKATRQWKHREFQQFCLFKVLLKKTQRVFAEETPTATCHISLCCLSEDVQLYQKFKKAQTNSEVS